MFSFKIYLVSAKDVLVRFATLHTTPKNSDFKTAIAIYLGPKPMAQQGGSSGLGQAWLIPACASALSWWVGQ